MDLDRLTGLDIAERYHQDVVRPLLLRRWPRLSYAAGRLGGGSEVLGLDDAMSRDHDWGLRLQVFVTADLVAAVQDTLEQDLPDIFLGLPTRFALTGSTQARPHVSVSTVTSFACDRLGFDPAAGISLHDWLSVTGQAMLEVTAGRVFQDDFGELARTRRELEWYPDGLWRYLLACAWRRIDQELPLMARAGDRGDDAGSRVIGARLVDVAMHLGFLLNRAWMPYPKWRGTQLTLLPGMDAATRSLRRALTGRHWESRLTSYTTALEQLLVLQREAGLPSPTSATEPFRDRPYVAVYDQLVPRLLTSIADEQVRVLPVGIGSIEQCCDNVDVLTHAARRRALVAALF